MTLSASKEFALDELRRLCSFDEGAELIRFCRRDILTIPYGPEGVSQPFYRSKGKDGQPGCWVPFDAIVPVSHKHPAIFDTVRFRNEVDPDLDRYGSSAMKRIGALLDAAQLPTAARDVFAVREVNNLLNTQSSRTANVLYDRYDLLARNRCRPPADEEIEMREARRANSLLDAAGIIPAGRIPDGAKDARDVPPKDRNRPGPLAHLRN